MEKPNLLGRRADLEVAELRIDRQESVLDSKPFLKARKGW
jgi:hypothetical protein